MVDSGSAAPAIRRAATGFQPWQKFNRRRSVADLDESWIKKDYNSQEVAILVSDMSGFTRLTKRYGIVHFASIIARARQIFYPIIKRFNPLFTTTEADNIIVIFPTAVGALMAAYLMQRAAKEYNKSLSPDRAHFALSMGGVGVHFGAGPLIDVNGKIHGPTFSEAYNIGEDLCEKGEVLLSGILHEAVKFTPEFATASFSEKRFEDDATANEIASKTGGVFCVSMDDAEPIELVSTEDARHLQPGMLALARRHNPTLTQVALETLDVDIKTKFMQKKAALMFQFEFKNTTGSQMELALILDCLENLQECFTRYGAEMLEDVLYSFDTVGKPGVADAILMALECRNILREAADENLDLDEKAPTVSIKGFGIHVGEILMVPDTDIHWGDPVNTASKLGQDSADHGDIIVSKEAYTSVQNDPRLKDLELTPMELTVSGVQFACYKILDTHSQKQCGADDQARIRAQFAKFDCLSEKATSRELKALFNHLNSDLTESDIQDVLASFFSQSTREMYGECFDDFIAWLFETKGNEAVS